VHISAVKPHLYWGQICIPFVQNFAAILLGQAGECLIHWTVVVKALGTVIALLCVGLTLLQGYPRGGPWRASSHNGSHPMIKKMGEKDYYGGL
jgi:hypothetical protein